MSAISPTALKLDRLFLVMGFFCLVNEIKFMQMSIIRSYGTIISMVRMNKLLIDIISKNKEGIMHKLRLHN